MSIQNQYLHRIAAFSMAVFGLCVFFRGVNLGEYRVLEDGSLMDSVERNLVCFKNSKTIFTLRAGFDIYRSVCYGVSSFFLLLDLLLNSGYLTLPALVLAGGEIVSDFSDFCLAIVLIALNIGGYQAAAYGLTYLTLLMIEVAIWLGTCKFHEYCRMYKIESKMLRKKQEDLSEGKMKERIAPRAPRFEFCLFMPKAPTECRSDGALMLSCDAKMQEIQNPLRVRGGTMKNENQKHHPQRFDSFIPFGNVGPFKKRRSKVRQCGKSPELSGKGERATKTSKAGRTVRSGSRVGRRGAKKGEMKKFWPSK